MLGLPVVQFSRGNVWVQVGPPSTWVVSVPKQDEALAIAFAEAYRHDPDHQATMPLAHRRYADRQLHFPECDIALPVEGQGAALLVPWRRVTFFDFCAGCDFKGAEVTGRQRPATVGHRNYSPDLEPEEFYYSKLLLHTVWTRPGDWLSAEDHGSHAKAFSRIAADAENHPTFLQSLCHPQMDGTVAAARQLQKVQATMYLKSQITALPIGVPSVEQEKYEGALQIMHALRRRHGDVLVHNIPDTIPSGLAAEAFAPLEGGEAAFVALTRPDPSAQTRRQQRAMVYVLQRLLSAPCNAASHTVSRLQLLIHGPGGCGKSFVLKAAAHKLRESRRGVIVAAYTGAAAFNVGGVTLHQCCSLPVTNRSYGQHPGDALVPQGAQLENLRTVWAHTDILFIDEISMVSAELLKFVDRNLRLARHRPNDDFGGVHVVAFGDLYQLPPPRNLPVYAASNLWINFELCELDGNHRAALDPDWAQLLGRVRVGKWTDKDIKVLASRVCGKRGSKLQPAERATRLYATRAAVASANEQLLHHHLQTRAGIEYHCPAADTYITSSAASPPENAYPNPEDTGGLEALLTVADDARVMLRLNLDVADGLSNGARGYVYEVSMVDDEVQKIWVKLDKGGQRWRDAHQHPDAVAIERQTARFIGKDGQPVQRKQFPLRLSWAETIHKSQGATFHGGVHARLDASVRTPAQAYVALSRSPTLTLLTLEAFNPKCLVVPSGAEWALNELHRANARRAPPKDAEQRALYMELIYPSEDAAHYDRRAKELGKPDWEDHRQRLLEAADGKEPGAKWTCPFCGFEAMNTYWEKRHARECAKDRRSRCSTKKRPAAAEAAGQAMLAADKCPAAAKRRIAKAQPQPNKPSRAQPPIHTAPPLPPPASPPPEVVWEGFFEQQVEARCGMHALNNVVGEHLFTEVQLEAAVHIFLDENQGLHDLPADHVGEGGWYSAEVLATALQSVAMAKFDRVMWNMPLLPATSAAQLHEAVGVLQHRPGPPGHWVALRSVDGHIFELDSLKEEPKHLSDEEAELLLMRYPASYAVMLV